MNSMNRPPKSKCPFCGEETLSFGIRGELAERCGARYWEDFYTYKCQACGVEWEVNVETGKRDITQSPGMRALKRLVESKDTDFSPCKYDAKKETTTMQVSYNGFTGELAKLERKPDMKMCHGYIYDISIYDSEKQVTHSFTGVNLEDVKFLGGAVSFQ